MATKKIEQKKDLKPTFSFLIEKKREGGEFVKEEIRQIVDAILDEEMPESQQAALLMAIFFKQMSANETASLAEELMYSGDTIDVPVSTPRITKVSTGGVGDKTTIVLAAIAAASGVVVPTMISGDEDYIIKTTDKLKAIPGFKTNLSSKDYVKNLTKTGCAIIDQVENIAPVNEALAKLRTETATVDSLPLMTSSILSKKYAEGCEGLVVDVKWGNGSYVKDLEQAKQLARMITRVARTMAGRKCVAVVTDANQPLGDCVGTGLEILEVVRLLKGEGDEKLKDLIVKMGMEVVRLAGVAGSTLSAKQMVERALSEGTALKKFREMVVAQGGSLDWIDNPEKFPKTKYVKKVPASKRGYVHMINAGLIARGVQVLAKTKDGAFDPAVGLVDLKKVGTQVKQGESLMEIHYNNEAQLEQAMEYLRNAYRLAPKRPVDAPFIVERVA